MSVTGYLALYTTLLGWQQYQNLWEIAVGTGLIYIPFIGIVLSSAAEPFTSMGAKDAAQIAVRRLTINIISAFLIIAFAAVPAISLDPKVLHYEPLCEANAKTVTPGDTGTTYDNAFKVPTGVKVPILWYFVMAFSNGITHAASVSLPCSPINYRELHSQLDTAKIQDPQLKQEVTQFYNDCYIPAYSTYMNGQLSTAQQAQIQQSLEKNGQADVGWFGSQTFLSISGIYDAQRASSPIKDFLFDPNRDIEEGQVNNHSMWGRPDCKTWWSDPNSGLYTKLKQSLPPDLLSSLLHIGNDTQTLQDTAIKSLISHSFHGNETLGDLFRGYESLNDNSKPGEDIISRVIGAPLGVLYESLSFYPKLHLLINALPVIQGTLLFALYAFLGLAIPFSSYRIGFCITGSIVIFSVIFCSYLWHLVAWLDNYLIQALYPSLANVQGLGILNTIVDGYGADSVNQLFVEMIIGTLYVVLPILWMSVMGWAGYQAGHHISGLISSMTEPAARSGEKSGSIITKRLP